METSSSSFILSHGIFTHRITLALEDVSRVSLDSSFVVQLLIQRDGEKVTFHLPALNFIFPVPGFVFTLANGLPMEIWPSDPVYQSNTLESDQTGLGYNLYIGNDGSLRITGLGGNPIPAGPQVTHAKTITYLLSKRNKLPKTFRLSAKRSNIVITTMNVIAQDFLDYYYNDFVNDTVAWCWADTTYTQTPPFNASIVVRVGKVINKHGKTKLKLQPQVQATFPDLNVYDCENSVAINPTNTDNLVITGRRTSISPRAVGPVTSASLDGGKTWSPVIFRSFAVGGGDPRVLFDRFGNCWLSYIDHQYRTLYAKH